MSSIRKTIHLFILSFFAIGMSAVQLYAKPEVRIEKATLDMLSNGCDEYILTFDDFPKNKDFIVSYSRAIQKDPGTYKQIDKLRIDDQNFLTVNEVDKALIYPALPPEWLAQGERIKYRASLLDGTIISETSFIPYPITKKSKNGSFDVKAELTSLFPTTYQISYEGLKPDETIHICSISGSEMLNFDLSANIFIHMPGILGKSGGISSLESSRNSGDKVILQLKWGDEITKEIMKKNSK